MKLLTLWKFLGQMALLKAAIIKPKSSSALAMACETSRTLENESYFVIHKIVSKPKLRHNLKLFYLGSTPTIDIEPLLILPITLRAKGRSLRL